MRYISLLAGQHVQMSRNYIFYERNGPMSYHAFIRYFQVAPAMIATFHPMDGVIIRSEMPDFGMPFVFTKGTMQTVKSPFGMTERTDQETPAIFFGQPGNRRFRSAYRALAFSPGCGSNHVPI